MNIDPLEQATGILGEHFKNYVVIVQDDETPEYFETRYSCPFATYGLMVEGSRQHQMTMATGCSIEDVAKYIHEEYGDAPEEEPQEPQDESDNWTDWDF